MAKSAKDYPWSSFRSYYSQGDEPLAVDHDWAWPDDAEEVIKCGQGVGLEFIWKEKGLTFKSVLEMVGVIGES